MREQMGQNRMIAAANFVGVGFVGRWGIGVGLRLDLGMGVGEDRLVLAVERKGKAVGNVGQMGRSIDPGIDARGDEVVASAKDMQGLSWVVVEAMGVGDWMDLSDLRVGAGAGVFGDHYLSIHAGGAGGSYAIATGDFEHGFGGLYGGGIPC